MVGYTHRPGIFFAASPPPGSQICSRIDCTVLSRPLQCPQHLTPLLLTSANVMSGNDAATGERHIGGFKFRLSSFQEAEKDSEPEEVLVVEPDDAAALIRPLAVLFGCWAMRRLFDSSSSVWSWPSLSGLSSRLSAGDPGGWVDCCR